MGFSWLRDLQVILDFTAKLLFSYDSETSPEKIGDNFADFLQGLMSFPLNIPGTAFHRCFQVSEEIPSSSLPYKKIGTIFNFGYGGHAAEPEKVEVDDKEHLRAETGVTCVWSRRLA